MDWRLVDLFKKCTTCQTQIIYDDTFDSYFCASCNEWLEEACEDPHCTYCVQRPNSPLSDNR